MAHGHRFDLIVGHIQRGDAQLPLQLHDLAAGVTAQLGIQVAERLIHQKDSWLPCNRPPQGHPLLLAAGQLLGQAIEQMGKVQHLSHLLHPLSNALFTR